jgi:hypothetical protein
MQEKNVQTIRVGQQYGYQVPHTSNLHIWKIILLSKTLHIATLKHTLPLTKEKNSHSCTQKSTIIFTVPSSFNFNSELPFYLMSDLKEVNYHTAEELVCITN